ncbi:MAG: lamin tail domain-containing protein, partial [Candidatus Thermoplasmatota archaeon]|nr:lamin tail domain-containing protein [Candidatus Thermoplasmatota archaeon]
MRKKIFMSFVLGILLFSIMPNVNCEIRGDEMPPSPNSVLIVEVYYYPYPNENDEYVKIYNQGGDSIDISNWSITDHSPNDNNKTGGGIIVFPSETILKTKSSFYVTENASAFYNSTGFMPDFEYEVNSLPNVSQMFYPDPGFVLSNKEGDNVVLKDKNDSVVDAVVYGDSDYIGMGWDSKSAKDVTEGTVLRRNTDEETGLYLDTNTSSDWDSLRTYKIGQSEFSYETFSFNGN